jgi:(E)-4-hydroxy-3-methylbut-2-enyl-diphosphate synthase
LVARYHSKHRDTGIPPVEKIPYSPFAYQRRKTGAVLQIGATHPPVVVSDFRQESLIRPETLERIGYQYDPLLDKWQIADAAADFIYTGDTVLDFPLPGTCKLIYNYNTWKGLADKTTIGGEEKYFPLFTLDQMDQMAAGSASLNFLRLNTDSLREPEGLARLEKIPGLVLCLYSENKNPVLDIRRFLIEAMNRNIQIPVILMLSCKESSIDRQLIHYAVETGALLVDGMGDGIWLINDSGVITNEKVSGRTYLAAKNNHQFLNNTAFSILQAARTRVSKTEYISCPSCGRTLFDLQETTAKIRSVTSHLKGLKIAIMGCIVNGPGEMADADFGYVGSGPGKITLYKGKEIMKRNVSSQTAVSALIDLLKESDAWVEPEPLMATR